MSVLDTDNKAKYFNSAAVWNELWRTEGAESWRNNVLTPLYNAIVDVIPENSVVIDLGGGSGTLATRLATDTKSDVLVIDHSQEALKLAEASGHRTMLLNLEEEELVIPQGTQYIVSTEVFEHLTSATREKLFTAIAASGVSFLCSVPNNRLDCDEEQQHTIKYTAISFKRDLAKYFGKDLYIDALGAVLLGVCGPIAHKDFTMSFTMPVRDEALDIEKTLCSFRGVADEMIIGVDPRTSDNTFEIASLYADEVFYIANPEGIPGTEEYQGEGKVHFAHCRNECLARCTSDWIVMSEGHEYLSKGHALLRSLEKHVPKQARVCFVFRQGDGQQWAFPWIFRNVEDIKFSRPVHNILNYPENTYCVKLPQVVTVHERSHDRAMSRAVQRKAQNRITLLDDWVTRGSENSLFYVAQEFRGYSKEKSIERFEQYLKVAKNGVQRYQARLILAREYLLKYQETKDKLFVKEARNTLGGCAGDDWTRTEHWIYLGDIAFMDKQYEQAYQFYTYASTTIGRPPFTLWWIDLQYYGSLPAQRLAMCCGELGRVEESLFWARKVLEVLPENAPDESIEECKNNIKILEEAVAMMEDFMKDPANLYVANEEQKVTNNSQ